MISYEPELLLARDRGATNLVGVGALVQTPLTSLMSIGSSKVRSPKDLAGKRVATAGIPYQSAYLKTILDKAGVDPGSVKETNVGFNLVPAMLSKKADATLGAFWNYEGVDLRQRGKDPRIFRMEDLGVPTYDELIFVARRQDLDQARRLEAAPLPPGHGARPPAAAQGPRRRRRRAARRPTTGLDRKLQEAAVKETLPVFFPSDSKHPFGWQDPDAWSAYAEWMFESKLLDERPWRGRAAVHERVPAGRGARAGPELLSGSWPREAATRRYSPASPFHSP